jgi:ketosteroid isomerase-like protein
MSIRPTVHRKRLLAGLATAGAALAVCVVLLVAATSSNATLSDEDRAAISEIVMKYAEARDATFVVPSGALPAVEARIEELKRARANKDSTVDTTSPVLAESVWRSIDDTFRATLRQICTPAYVDKVISRETAAHESEASGLAQALFNNLGSALYAGFKHEITSLTCKGEVDGNLVIWAQIWTEDISHRFGPVGESWPVFEYVVSKQPDGRWLIADDVFPIWHCGDLSAGVWGPDSPHQSLGDGEPEGWSVLHPRKQVSASEFLTL